VVRYVRALGPEHSQKSFEEALSFLSDDISEGERLLIIDNVDDSSINIEPLLPQWDHGAMIITTRNHILGHIAPNGHIQLDSMSEDEAIETLSRASLQPWPPVSRVPPEIKKICSELGYLAIALVQAGSYMAQTATRPRSYLSKLQASRTTVMKHPAVGQRDMSRYKSVYAAFDASYEALPVQVQNFLRLLGAFHWNQIPVDHIQRAAKEKFEGSLFMIYEEMDQNQPAIDFLVDLFLVKDVWSVSQWDTTIITLQNYSFATFTSGSAATLANIHPVTHMWLNDLSSSLGDQDLLQAASVRLLGCWSGHWHTSDQYLVPQALYHLSQDSIMNIQEGATFAKLLSDGGEPHSALDVWTKIVRKAKEMYGEEEELTLTAVEWLAECYYSLGWHKKALELRKEALKVSKRTRGQKHRRTLLASANLAMSHVALGQNRQAEQLSRDVLRMSRETLGEKDFDTISALSNLAAACSACGQHLQAEKLNQHVLQEWKKTLGEKDPNTIRAMANLAASYSALGKHEEALKLELDALRLSKKVLGRKHPDTLVTAANAAASCAALGLHQQSEQIEQEILRLRKEILGEEHPDTILASANLARSYAALGRHEEAEKLEKDVLRLRKKILGKKHPDTIQSSENLAVSYAELGRDEQAEQLQQTVVKLRTEVLGPEHPDTLSSIYNLAVYQSNIGQHEQARTHAERARVLMEEMPYTHPWYDDCVSLIAELDE
jgi:tetratricopeptide (TPR) repeat protein